MKLSNIINRKYSYLQNKYTTQKSNITNVYSRTLTSISLSVSDKSRKKGLYNLKHTKTLPSHYTFCDHFVPKRNVIHERACFHKRAQKPGESVEAFVRNLYELAQYCEFGHTKDEQIRDRIVIGISDNDVSQ